MGIEKNIELILQNTFQIIEQNDLLKQEVETLKSIITNKEDKLLSINQVAELLQVSRNTIYNYRKDGKLKTAIVKGRRHLFWESEVFGLKKTHK